MAFVCVGKSVNFSVGVAAGAHYTHTGSGSNYLCLPMDPLLDMIIPGVQNPSIIYGTEYQTSGTPLGEYLMYLTSASDKRSIYYFWT